MADSHRWIQKHWRRLQWGQFLGLCADHLALTLIAVGCWILLVKLFLPMLWPHALWAGLLLVAVPFYSWRKVRLRHFTISEATALLDRKLAAGGLLMTLSESPDAQWQAHLPHLESLWRESLPKIRPKRFASLVTVPLIFAVVACLIPLREESPLLATPRKVAQETSEELKAILKTLEESEILKEEEKEKLEKELQKFAEQTHNQALTHEQWETADALRQQMQMHWERNERNLEAAANAVEELLSALEENRELSAEQLEQSIGQNLQDMAQKAGQGNKSGMSEKLKKALEKMAQTGKLPSSESAQERQEMLKELKEKLKQESERLAKERSECQGLCQGSGECAGGNCPGGNQPGQGGVNRGRGDAPMVWGKESDLSNTKFKEVVLPPSDSQEASEEVLGVTKHAPEVNPSESAPRQALRETDPAAGRATWDRKLNPKHREVVRKFFHSERKTQAIPADQEL